MTGGAKPAQLPLFGGGATPAGPHDGGAAEAGGRSARMSGGSGGVGAAEPPGEIVELAARLPFGVQLGGSTWSFPGWAGLVYDREHPTARLARDGLAAYARHPLLRAVGLDRTHYRPIAADDFARYAAVVPEGFSFLVKAHDACTLAQLPDHPRYGAERGRVNPRFLDPVYAAAEVVAPYVQGLGDKGGALLFQFAPQALGPPPRFAARLHRFLAALPRGPVYAVELRNRELLTADYAAALAVAGAVHCLNVHPRMPPVGVQAGMTAAATGPVVCGRWLLGSGSYEEAGRRFAPFNRLVEPDLANRRALASLADQALAAGRRFLLTVNNNAEGSAPRSIALLARRIVEGAGEAESGA